MRKYKNYVFVSKWRSKHYPDYFIWTKGKYDLDDGIDEDNLEDIEILGADEMFENIGNTLSLKYDFLHESYADDIKGEERIELLQGLEILQKDITKICNKHKGDKNARQMYNGLIEIQVILDVYLKELEKFGIWGNYYDIY